MTQAKTHLFLAPALAIAFFHAHGAFSEILSEEDVRALTWPAALPMTLLTASDGVFNGGPDYVFRDPDAWLTESDVVEHRSSFEILVRNTSIYPVDDVLFLAAHRGDSFSMLSVGGCVVRPGNFGRFDGEPFGPTGNRPGAGETTLYNSANGVVFLRIGRGIAPDSTLKVPVEILHEDIDCTVHFDVYGLRRSKVFCSCPSTSDVTCRPALSPAATLQETLGKIKIFFAP